MDLCQLCHLCHLHDLHVTKSEMECPFHNHCHTPTLSERGLPRKRCLVMSNDLQDTLPEDTMADSSSCTVPTCQRLVGWQVGKLIDSPLSSQSLPLTAIILSLTKDFHIKRINIEHTSCTKTIHCLDKLTHTPSHFNHLLSIN